MPDAAHVLLDTHQEGCSIVGQSHPHAYGVCKGWHRQDDEHFTASRKQVSDMLIAAFACNTAYQPLPQ